MSIVLKFQSSYKSIIGLQDTELPDFTVITGLNGSGKSQLLESISSGGNCIQVQDGQNILSSIKLVNGSGFIPNNLDEVGVEQVRKSTYNLRQLYRNYKQQMLSGYSHDLRQYIHDPKHIKLIEYISIESQKNIENLDDDDFIRHYPIDDGLSTADVFQQNLSLLFKRYHLKSEDNSYNEFLFNTGKDVPYLNQEQFVNKYGSAPWEILNKILAVSQINYEVNNPEGTHRDTPFNLKLKNKINNAEVKFQDLSSGEKVIISLALSLYNLNTNVDFPQVLLMDEPDAPLHPSMIKQFLDVVQQVFVREKKVKVIITTHSPSTIALSPEDSIFVMNATEPRLMKVSKDKALSILTSGVPTLSINYDNRRQVFVESKYDQFYYENIYRKLLPYMQSHISLNFLCAGYDGSAGCKQVKEIVKKLAGYGNRQVFGVIDWDLKNNNEDRIKVLGYNARYSIENYILDPVLFSVYLIRDLHVNKAGFGISDDVTVDDIKGFDDSQLQSLIDAFFIMASKIKPGSASDSLTKSFLVNGRSVNIPTWYFELQGHELEASLKSVFKSLNSLQKVDLKKDVILKVFNDYPGLISKDFIELFKSISDCY